MGLRGNTYDNNLKEQDVENLLNDLGVKPRGISQSKRFPEFILEEPIIKADFKKDFNNALGMFISDNIVNNDDLNKRQKSALINRESIVIRVDLVEKYKDMYWKRLLGVELKYKHILQQQSVLNSQFENPDFDWHEVVRAFGANNCALRMYKREWDNITIEMVETRLFNDDELGKALVDYKSQVFNFH